MAVQLMRGSQHCDLELERGPAVRQLQIAHERDAIRYRDIFRIIVL